jgi:hypothetical protein
MTSSNSTTQLIYSRFREFIDTHCKKCWPGRFSGPDSLPIGEMFAFEHDYVDDAEPFYQCSVQCRRCMQSEDAPISVDTVLESTDDEVQ